MNIFFLKAALRPRATISSQLRICRYYSASASPNREAKTPPNELKKKSSQKKSQASKSSCPPNTVLTGLNYLKGQPPVVALPDEEYPDWLWNVLKPREYEDDGPGGKKERAERRKINRQAIKDRNFMQTQ